MGRPGRARDVSTAVREFGVTLRRRRDERGLTQLQVADRLGVQRATLSQWETGRHLPSAENAAQLDTLLSTGSELADLAELARPDAGEVDVRPETPRVSLREIYARLGRAMVDRLRRNHDGVPLGWSHDFLPDLPPTALSTAFGVKTLQMIDAPPVDHAALAEALLARQEGGGGWGARRMRARPESTAAVVDALTRIGGRVDVDAELQVIEGLTDGAARSSTYVLAAVLEIVARLRPDSAFTHTLSEALLGLRRTVHGGSVGWPEKGVVATSMAPALSTAHTARAVIALATQRDTGSAPDKVGDAVEQGVDWLQRHAVSAPIRENLNAIDRTGAVGDLEIRHMTPALVARALALAERPDWPRIHESLERLWALYDPKHGLWFWPNGDLPPWLQFDAVAATRTAAERSVVVGLPSPQGP